MESPCESRCQELEAAMRIVWFKSLLPAMDYEVKGGTWEEPRWAWREHSWFRLLGLTDEECITSLQSPELHRSEIDELEDTKA